MKYKLYEKTQAHTVMLAVWEKIKQALDGGKKVILEISEENRSDPQNKKYHAIIGQIAKQASHAGAQWDTESWKRLLIDQWAKDTNRSRGELVASLSGDGIIQLGLQSRKFTKEEGADFIEWLLAWSAQNGIDIKEPE